MRQPLIDCDVLLYEVGFAVEVSWKAEGHEGLPPFDKAAESIDFRIQNICAMVEADTSPILYLTGKGNFRYEIATTTPYKDRPSNKPFHYKNLKAYVKGKYDYLETVGMEADDALSLEATRRPTEVVVCTRDKDLRSVPGWSYGWECHNQPEWGPKLIGEVGYVALSNKRDKLIGEGGMFFYGQCLTGDSVDSIPGMGGKTGAVKAFKILDGATTLREAFERVREAYRGLHGDVEGDKRLLEQGRLLNMTRYVDEWGNPVLWEFPYGES